MQNVVLWILKAAFTLSILCDTLIERTSCSTANYVLAHTTQLLDIVRSNSASVTYSVLRDYEQRDGAMVHIVNEKYEIINICSASLNSILTHSATLLVRL